ncbi:MAG: transcription elongation factor GreA [Armatimonadota bacterium]|nr:transcription elongation factor GreA [Armatimonadota bacterium]
MREDFFITPTGREKLLAELEDLTGPRRQAVTAAIREARSHGDLKENAAYHEAKLNQGRLEGRIAEIQHILDVARPVDRPADAEGAHLGSVVTYVDLDSGKETTATLVGQFEADPLNGLVSIQSPVGSAMLGKKDGDLVDVEVPAGVRRYEVKKVSYEV